MPSKFELYINQLDGQENLDPLKIAKDLHDLYQEDVTTRDAKIEELNATVAERDGSITANQDEIKNWKAKNFDLVMQLPGTPSPDKEEPPESDEVTSIDDLFVKG